MILAGGAGGTIAGLPKARAADGAAAGFPAPVTAIPFGVVSHWLQPWRELCQVRSWDEVAGGIGAGIGSFGVQQDALVMLRQHGFRLARIELGWGLVDPTKEDQFQNQAEVIALLARLRKADLRPLILLNANDGHPCPFVAYPVQLLADAQAGAQSVTLVSTAGLVPGRSGFGHFSKAPLGSVLVKAIDGQRVSLSRPLPEAIAGGATVGFVTLNYEPFSAPGSTQNERTIAGWLNYVDLVCKTATAALGTAGANDRGFDLEIWNELTFGSRFLSINNYYEPALLQYNSHLIYGEIVQRTAARIAAAPSDYRGVGLTDGFGNTTPWTAASQEPPRVNAISKHPYPPILGFPESQKSNAVGLDALGQRTSFVPSYKAFFPEYFGNVIQSESICRDVSDQDNQIGSVRHGRLARVVNGKVSPVDLWITEIGCYAGQLAGGDPAQLQRQLAAFAVRSVFFHLGIGVTRVYLFQAFGRLGSYGLVDQATPTTPSLPVLLIARLLGAMRGDEQAGSPGMLAQIRLAALRGPADASLFAGGGTSNLPPMTTADSLVLLPIQASANRIAVIYYIMTRDIRVPLDAQPVKLAVQLQNILNYSVTSYDPLKDAHSTLEHQSTGSHNIEVQLSATDMPKLLIFNT